MLHTLFLRRGSSMPAYARNESCQDARRPRVYVPRDDTLKLPMPIFGSVPMEQDTRFLERYGSKAVL